jgi:hypothetical protein
MAYQSPASTAVALRPCLWNNTAKQKEKTQHAEQGVPCWWVGRLCSSRTYARQIGRVHSKLKRNFRLLLDGRGGKGHKGFVVVRQQQKASLGLLFHVELVQRGEQHQPAQVRLEDLASKMGTCEA